MALITSRVTRLRLYSAVGIAIFGLNSGWTQTAKKPAASKPKTTAQEPLTLSVNDLYNKSDLLAKAAELSSQGEPMRGTGDYVARYRELQRGIQYVKPPLGEWTAEEQAKIKSIPVPTEEGLKNFEASQKRAAEKVQARVDAAQDDFERKRASNLKQEERDQQAREAELQAAQRQAEVDAYRQSIEDMNGYYTPYPVYNYPVIRPRPRPRR